MAEREATASESKQYSNAAAARKDVAALSSQQSPVGPGPLEIVVALCSI